MASNRGTDAAATTPWIHSGVTAASDHRSQINHGPATDAHGAASGGDGGRWSGEGRGGGHLGRVEPPQLPRAQRQEGAEGDLHCDGHAGEGDPEPLPEVEPAPPGRRWRDRGPRSVPPVPVAVPLRGRGSRGRGVGGGGGGGRCGLPLRGGHRRRRGGSGGGGGEEGRGGEEEEREEEGQRRGSGGCGGPRAWRHGRGRGIKGERGGGGEANLVGMDWGRERR